MKKFLIYAPTYDENEGGTIVLHKLCSMLNDAGREAYLWSFCSGGSFCADTYLYGDPLIADAVSKGEFRDAQHHWELHGKNEKRYGHHKTQSPFPNVRLYGGTPEDGLDAYIVIYAETIAGNPLRAKNVVRWLLHQPGWHTGRIDFGTGEIYFKYGKAIRDFTCVGSVISSSELKIVNYPRGYYNQVGARAESSREGAAHCFRKQSTRHHERDVQNSLCIDGLSHAEISEIFKRIKIFTSYDLYTAYSRFAAMCGCLSIVVPANGVTEEQWQPDERDRVGIAYGPANIEHAVASLPRLPDVIQNDEQHSLDCLHNFAREVDEHFRANPRQILLVNKRVVVPEAGLGPARSQ